MALLLSLVVFAVAVARTLELGAAELDVSDRAFDAGELERAVRHARRAAALYVPSAAHVAAAHARLRAVALGAERARDLGVARSAWRALRASVLESRHVWQPHASELTEAEANLMRLEAAARLPRPSVMAPGAAGVLAGCFALGVLGFVGSVWRGLGASGRWAFQRARAPIALLALGVLGFGLTLYAI